MIENLSENERNAILDNANGCSITKSSKAVDFVNLETCKKWNVDYDLLLEKMDKLSEIENTQLLIDIIISWESDFIKRLEFVNDVDEIGRLISAEKEHLMGFHDASLIVLAFDRITAWMKLNKMNYGIKTNFELLYTQLNKVYIELGSRLRDDKSVVNWFNNETQNVTDIILSQVDNFKDNSSQELRSKFAELNRKFHELLSGYEIEFYRFNILENLLTDIENNTLS